MHVGVRKDRKFIYNIFIGVILRSDITSDSIIFAFLKKKALSFILLSEKSLCNLNESLTYLYYTLCLLQCTRKT